MRIIFILLILLLNSDIKEDAENSIRSFFNKEIKLEFYKYDLPDSLKTRIERECRQRFLSNYIYVWKIFYNNKRIATAMMDNVLGKSLPITFIVIFDLDGKILDTEIIKYRESYGGAVQEKHWLNQFKGKDESSQFKVGKDVSSISGATISANSVTTGIKKLSILYSIIKNNI